MWVVEATPSVAVERASEGGHDPIDALDVSRRTSLEVGAYCFNDGCNVVGHLKDFKVCPQSKTAWYCGAANQRQHWTAGGHTAIRGA